MVAGSAVAGLLGSAVSAQAAGEFVDVTAELGVGVYASMNLGPGVAMADIDNDGDLELYAVDGDGDPNRLFVNQGGRVFTEMGASYGVDHNGPGKAATFVDYDNDGDQDLLVTCHGITSFSRLFRNDGTSSFTDVTSGSGFNFANWSTGAAWADYDNDGLLDCYVTVYVGDKKNRLLRNLGGGVFQNVAPALGMENATGWGFQPAWLDYDNDGFMDLYVANDVFGTPNVLYRNRGDGSFEDVSVASGADTLLACMGLATGDYDNDGDVDIYMTNVQWGNVLLANNGDGTFSNATPAAGVEVFAICWGADWLDYDNDGWLDLYVDAQQPTGTPSAPPSPNKLYRNLGGGLFDDISAGSGANNAGFSFCSAVGDYDQDGDLDIYVGNWDREPGALPSSLLENQHAPRGEVAHDYLRIRLQGTVSNRDAVGTRVEVTTAAGTQVRYRQAGTAYLSSSEPTLHFGLGNAPLVESVVVRWPSGIVETLDNVLPGQTILLVEGAVASIGDVLDWTITAAPAITTAYPNPGNDLGEGATIRWTRGSLEVARWVVRDVAGRRIVSAPVPEGHRAGGHFTWNLRAADGSRLPAGAYFLSLQDVQGGVSSARKVVVVR